MSTPTPISVTGQMHVTNDYTVTSVNAPDKAGLASLYNDQYGENISTGDLISHIFGNDPGITIGGGNDWVFAYHTGGSSMTQVWNTDPSTWGNITG